MSSQSNTTYQNTLQSPAGLSISTDIVLEIVKLLLDEKRGGFVALQICSRALYTIVTPILYRHIHFNEKSLPAFVYLLGNFGKSQSQYKGFFQPAKLGVTGFPDALSNTSFFTPDSFTGHRVRMNLNYVQKITINYDMHIMRDKPFKHTFQLLKNFKSSCLFPRVKHLVLEGTEDEPLSFGPYGIWFILPDICSLAHADIRWRTLNAIEWAQPKVNWGNAKFTLHEQSIHFLPPSHSTLSCTISSFRSYSATPPMKIERRTIEEIFTSLTDLTVRRQNSLSRLQGIWRIILHNSPYLIPSKEIDHDEPQDLDPILEERLGWTKSHKDLFYKLKKDENEITVYIYNKPLEEYDLNSSAVLEDLEQNEKFRYSRINWITGKNVEEEPPCQACSRAM